MSYVRPLLISAAAGAAVIVAAKIVSNIFRRASSRQKKRIPKLKLYYFDVPGKGEAIRLACSYAGIPLEDVRVPMNDRSVFDKLKNEGKLTFGQLPALEIDGKEFICQSAVIMRYIGHLANLYPDNNEIICTLIDSVVEQEVDMFMGLSVSRYRDRFGFGSLTEAEVSVIRTALNDQVLPRHLGFMESLLEKSSTGWIAGTERPSVADFILVPRLQWLESGANDGISKDILAAYPRIQTLIQKFLSLPQIKAYYANK